MHSAQISVPGQGVGREHSRDAKAMKLMLGRDVGRGGSQRDPAPLLLEGAEVRDQRSAIMGTL